MKHLYKTKGGEILEAYKTYHYSELVELENEIEYNLSDVQEVVLDKDGKPFMFEGNVVCVGDEIGGYYKSNGTIIKYLPVNDGIHILLNDKEWIHSTNITSHTPKHPQKKGIKKIEVEKCYVHNKDIARKLNELIDEVNKLKG